VIRDVGRAGDFGGDVGIGSRLTACLTGVRVAYCGVISVYYGVVVVLHESLINLRYDVIKSLSSVLLSQYITLLLCCSFSLMQCNSVRMLLVSYNYRWVRLPLALILDR
jgi:hypothetical protein